ncbi:hypothetical protein [Psychrobacter sp. JCM 18900]|uniref:hypothetical protein n=1 Tax=Psychrobacter sp. JCM 18900 TaxID=1298608 RepID=UPI0021C3E85E|nr:hypothetical protein [Psychrobacter sp. JCM 18900]
MEKNVASQKISLEDKDSLVMASSSYSWPSMLLKASKEKDDSAFTTVLSKVEIGQYCNKNSEISQKIITYFLLGLAFNEYSRNYLLNVLRNHVSSNVYYNILLELSVLGFENELDAHWVWWLSETNNDDFALAILERNTLKSKRSKLIKNILEGSGLNNSFSEKNSYYRAY